MRASARARVRPLAFLIIARARFVAAIVATERSICLLHSMPAEGGGGGLSVTVFLFCFFLCDVVLFLQLYAATPTGIGMGMGQFNCFRNCCSAAAPPGGSRWVRMQWECVDAVAVGVGVSIKNTKLPFKALCGALLFARSSARSRACEGNTMHERPAQKAPAKIDASMHPDSRHAIPTQELQKRSIERLHNDTARMRCAC